jgi:hypothetical protein
VHVLMGGRGICSDLCVCVRVYVRNRDICRGAASVCNMHKRFR